MAISSTPPTSPFFPCSQARSIFRSRLGGALRTALACAAVGVATVYGPAALRRQATFPAFSYVTAILIAGEATLGDAIHGTVSAVCGTALGALPAALTLFLIPPEHFSVMGASLAVGLSAFAVVLPVGSTSLITKRIALSQIVLIYAAVLRKDAADSVFGAAASHDLKAFMHPVHVAVSTAVGVVASLLAVLLPYPRLAFYEVTEKGRIYRGMAAERLRLLVNAFFAEDSSSFVAFTSQALSLKLPSTKLLQAIKLKQPSTQWELPPLLLKSSASWPENLEETEVALQGMEMALASTTTSINILFNNRFLVKDDNSDYLQLKFCVVNLRDHLIIKLLRDYHHLIKANFAHDDLLLDLQYDHLHLLPHSMPQSAADLSPFFFLFCLKLLQVHGADDQPMMSKLPTSPDQPAGKVMPTTEHTEHYSCRDQNPNPSTRLGLMFIKTKCWFLNLVSSERIIVALKCSLSVGLAVFFGAVFSRDSAYWSGLAVAVTITPWREATFKQASLRAQGTTLGSVYGVLGALLFQNLMELRFLVLLPWIIFTSFLQRSRMFGPAGGVAAAISAIFILGRENYGSPTAFAITRLVETYIGCACSIFVELALQPKRASVLAKEQLRQSFAVFIDCMEHSLSPSTISSVAWREKENLLRQQVNALRKWIGEAETEPNFWFIPFPVDSYKKLHFSVSKMADLLSFLIKSLKLLEERRQKYQDQDQQPSYIDGDTIEQFKMLICSSLKCIQEIIQVKSLSGKILHDGHKEKIKAAGDIEAAAAAAAAAAGRDNDKEMFYPNSFSRVNQEECDNMVASLLGKAKEVIERVIEVDDVESKSRAMLCFATLGFCIDGMMRETREIEKGILELLQSQNPGKHINLQEILKQITSNKDQE